jgi:hypothetical protein
LILIVNHLDSFLTAAIDYIGNNNLCPLISESQRSGIPDSRASAGYLNDLLLKPLWHFISLNAD